MTPNQSAQNGVNPNPMNTAKLTFFGFILSIAILGCGRNEDSALMVADVDQSSATQESHTEADDRKLIKEGNVEFETDNLDSSRRKIFRAVKKYNGYISSDKESKNSGRESNIIIIRVPAQNFDNLLNDATQGVDKFDSKIINVKDVTEEFLDTEARLKTKKDLEARYRELLKQAKNVSEILEIEKQLGEVRGEIESMEGRLRYLQNRVSYSTLSVTFYKNIAGRFELGRQLANGFKNGWDILLWLLVGLTNIWPFVLIGIGSLVGLKWYKRREGK